MTRFRYKYCVKLKKLLAVSLAGIMLAACPFSRAALAAESETAEGAGEEVTEDQQTGSVGQPDPPPAVPDPAPSQPDPAPAPDPAPDPSPAENGGEENQNPSEGTGQGTDISGEGTGTVGETGDTSSEGTGTADTEGLALTEEPESTGKTEKTENTDERVEDEHELEAVELATGSNEDLLAGLTITSLPAVTLDYRFYHVDCDYSMARFKIYVREDQNDSARIVGTIPFGGLLYVLEDLGDWIYVESGDVRGFARSGAVYDTKQTARMLEEAEKQIGITENILSPLALLEQIREAYVPEFGSLCLPPEENRALTFTKATGRTKAKKVYAFAAEELQILEGTDGGARAVGSLVKDGMCCILSREEDGYVFVESGDVRGFVKESSLVTGREASKKAKEGGEFTEAVKLVDPLDNKVLFHTILSVKNGDRSSGTRQTLIDLARKCLGHAYIWGGIDPFGNGADCSGFVQTLYRCIGIQLPRVAQDQAFYSGGIKIPVSDAAPGDLIFFARNGYIYHVAMCYDNNEGAPTTIEALGRSYGICYYHTAGRDTIWALRILE